MEELNQGNYPPATSEESLSTNRPVSLRERLEFVRGLDEPERTRWLLGLEDFPCMTSEIVKNEEIPLEASEGESSIDSAIIPCPNCGIGIVTGSPRPNGAVVKWMRIPEAQCDCGFSGPIEWTNHQFAAQMEQAVSAREQQRNQYDRADI